MDNYYEILKIKSDASQKEIRKAYLDLSKIYHPDKKLNNKNYQDFIIITTAYKTLTDKTLKLKYDKINSFHQHYKDVSFEEKTRKEKNKANYDAVQKLKQQMERQKQQIEYIFRIISVIILVFFIYLAVKL